MPESVTDRPTSATEMMFLLAKSQKYFYDAEAVKEESQGNEDSQKRAEYGRYDAGNGKAKRNNRTGKPDYLQARGNDYGGGTRNLRNWWPVVSEPYKEAHFATFGRKWIEPCILAGTSEKGVCPKCGGPWVRVVEKSGGRDWHNDKMKDKGIPGQILGNAGYKRGQSTSPLNNTQTTVTTGWSQACTCNMAYPDYGAAKDDPAYVPYAPIPATVLDPFAGSGTTGLVAYEHGREFIGIELSPEYVKMAEKRIARATAQGRLF